MHPLWVICQELQPADLDSSSWVQLLKMPSTHISVAALLALVPFTLAAPATTSASTTPDSAAATSTSAPSAPPLRSHPTSISHGPYLGTATTTGALTAASGILGTAIPSLPPNPNATTYPSDGKLHDAEPAPYVPAGGVGTNGTPPVYNAKSDFDYESLVCFLHCLAIKSHSC